MDSESQDKIQHGIRVTYPDGMTKLIKEATRVDETNFHEGMIDFYDAQGNLLEQIDMGSSISWENIARGANEDAG